MITLTFVIYFLTIIFTHTSAFGTSQESQLPPHGISPLFTFGHTILEKNHSAVAQEILYAKTEPFPTWLFLTEIYYGITDTFTLSGNIPAVHQKSCTKSKNGGLGDCYINLNSHIYDNKTDLYDYRMLGIVGVRFPTTTGAFGKTIYTYNTYSLFLGFTYDALTHDWFLYNDIGALLFLKKGKTQFGHFFNINTGIARTFNLKENFLSFFLELSDFYSLPNKICRVIDLTTGGNILLIGPTVRYAHKNGFLIQVGIQFNVSENLRNKCATIGYLVGGFIAYSF